MISVGAFMSEHSKEGNVWQGPASVPCSQEEILGSFHGWEPEVLALLKASNEFVPLISTLTSYYLVYPKTDKVGYTNHEADGMLCEKKRLSCR